MIDINPMIDNEKDAITQTVCLRKWRLGLNYYSVYLIILSLSIIAGNVNDKNEQEE
jgi:hypothetical protein